MFFVLGILCGVVAFVCSIVILVHAFTKGGVLQGILCLCIPFYILFYALLMFEHPKKNTILTMWIGAHVLTIVFFRMSGAMMLHPIR